MAAHVYHTVSELKENIDEFVDKASHGEEIVVVRDDRPVAKLVAIHSTSPAKRQLGDVKGIWISPQFAETPDDFEGIV